MLDSCFMELKLDCSSDNNFAVLNSNDFSVGGHLWRIRCYPRGCPHEHNNDGKGDRISFFVELRSRSPPKSGIKAFFQAFAVTVTSTQALTTSVQVYRPIRLLFLICVILETTWEQRCC
ncbi:hypothetical protein PR202_ga21546 [Eleusine coracana subsp. coracana]|uniref:MATH domain-containing protein n=1 Tax=Eleusine coracana subsp. coracana TaxID=191504 RepID=A0AAV5D0W8_ELECO|nr:hypothetical protein PR202_ga21546 [Eleusine coracana subsp. coracana]